MLQTHEDTLERGTRTVS